MEDRQTLMVERHPLQGEPTFSQNTETCDTCGATLYVGAYPFCGGDPSKHGAYVQTHGDSGRYPYTTKNITGQEITITDAGHERALLKEHGLAQRDDVAFLEKEYVGYNHRTGKQEYKEGRGVGMPGCWV